MKIYLAGPMSGIPKFNYPRFEEVANILREEFGHEVLNPAEMDDEETRNLAMASKTGNLGSDFWHGESWGDFLSRDVKVVADMVDGVVLLEGWEGSRGARMEAFVAASVMKPVYQWVDEHGPIEITPDILCYSIAKHTATRDMEKEKRYG